MRHLRPGQAAWWAWRKARTPRPVTRATSQSPPLRPGLAPGPPAPVSHLGGGRFLLLNAERDLGWPPDWSAPDAPRLWRYQLHYQDCLRQPGMDADTGLALCRAWLAGNPPAAGGDGWDPYPTSLRLVNWLLFFDSGPEPDAELCAGLRLMAANLARRVERHLSANHLFANGKALWFAGVLLAEPGWARLGRGIVLAELDEQFLPDGGHYELSPMYHCLGLLDLLHLAGLLAASGQDPEAQTRLRAAAGRALAWLNEIASCDGTIPLLNDSAWGQAPSRSELLAYARALGVEPDGAGIARYACGGWDGADLSGYQMLHRPGAHLIFDCAPLGPGHQPGHAHADLLAVHLELAGRPVLTDSGVYEYAAGGRRAWCRGTAAHNTVTIDGLDQAEMWGEFRVGRRGRPRDLARAADALACSHDGYAHIGVSHRRTLSLMPGGVVVADFLRGTGRHRFAARYHLAPGLEPVASGGDYLLPGLCALRPFGAEHRLETSPFFPEFGREETRACLVLEGEFKGEARPGLAIALAGEAGR